MITRFQFAVLVVQARARTGVQEPMRDEIESVWRWARDTRASRDQVMEELLDILSTPGPVIGGRTRGRSTTLADVDYHGAPIGEN